MSERNRLSLNQCVHLFYWISLPIIAGAFVRVAYMNLDGTLSDGEFWATFGTGLLYGAGATVLTATPAYFFFLLILRGRRVLYLLLTYIAGTSLVGFCLFRFWQSEYWEYDQVGYLGFALMGLAIGVGQFSDSKPVD